MVASLTEEQRVRLAHCAEEGLGYKAAAKKVGCSATAARRWITRWKAARTVQPLEHKGRAQELSEGQGDQALDLLLSRRFMGAAGVAHELHTQGVTARVLSAGTVLRAAKAAAKRAGMRIHFWRGRPRERLSTGHMQARLAFARQRRGTNWQRIVFTDRKKFWWHYPGSKVPHCCWLRHGDYVEARYVGARRGVNVYCGLTPYGLTAMHVVAGTWGAASKHLTKKGKPARGITSAEYRDVLSHTLLPEGVKLMEGRWGKEWVFQQDGDKAHGGAAATIEAFNKAKGQRIQFLTPWPARSCDLNPIEHIWAYVQRKLNARGCNTWAAFKAAVGQELRLVPQSLIDSLYSSMGRRMEAVIRAEGGRVAY